MRVEKLNDTQEKGAETDVEYLNITVYAANVMMGSEGIFPMLLIFGAFPYPNEIAHRRPM